MKTPNSFSRGFTLIELMVALVIFAIGVTALIMTHAGIMQSNTRSVTRSGAVVELENLMERTVAMSKMRYPNGRSGYDSLWNMGVGGLAVHDSVMGIQRRLRIDSLIGTRTTSGTILLTGTVSWTTGTRADSLNARIRLTRHD
jgi:prepilin-type N-terminal cleavage/methylation domain-containing protein